MKACRTVLFVFAVSCLATPIARAARDDIDDFSDVAPELAELNKALLQLRQEINCLNLINGLNLTRDQIEKILALADEQKETRVRYGKRAESEGRDMLRTFTELKGILESGQSIPEDTVHKVQRLDRRNLVARNRVAEELGKAKKKLDGILTDAQLEVVESFKPCIIPPQNLRDPVRAGQASESPRGEHMLRRIREMPDHVYRRAREHMVDRHMRFVQEGHGKYTKSEQSKEKKRIQKLMDQVRAMSEVDFEMKKAELGVELKPKDKIGDFVKQIEKARPGGGKSKAARFLLCSAGVSVLRKKIETMAAE